MQTLALRLRSSAFVLGMASLLATDLAARDLKLIQATTVDAHALTFADGPATRFDNVVNGRTHQQWPLTSFRGFQYVTWFDDQRRVCIARRPLPDGDWQTIRFDDHRFETNDSHNSAVLGVCHADGTIHMAFDHHATPLNYRVSQPGVALEPESVRWDASLFSGVRHRLGSVTPHERVTYPRFFNAPNGNLLFYYRSVTSADGDGMIEEYCGDCQDWTPGLGRFISRDTGVFEARGRTSLFRCPYMDALSYAGDRLHATWGWRDRFDRTSARNNHDLCYAYSDDHGRTWRNSGGQLIGETGKSPIHLDSPGLVVADIPINSSLSNQNTHFAFPDGSIHVVLLRRDEKRGERAYHHHWRTSDGQWLTEPLGFSGDRPTLVGTKQGSLILVYSNGRAELKLALGTPNRHRTKWRWQRLSLPQTPSCFGDPVVDIVRWKQEEVLSVYCQEFPERILETQEEGATDGIATPLKVVDFRWTE